VLLVTESIAAMQILSSLAGKAVWIRGDVRSHGSESPPERCLQQTCQQLAYLASWINLLKESPRVLLQVLADARRAADLICPEAQDLR